MTLRLLGSSILLKTVLLLLPGLASAQVGQKSSGTSETVADRRTPPVRSVEAAAPTPLDSSRDLENIEIDGWINEAEWEVARVFTRFTQREPVEGGPAENDTEVRVLFGDDAIWIAARMWDAEPELIDRRLTRRDQQGSFDQFSIHLDPNLDGLTGYNFRVSAAGVQGD